MGLILDLAVAALAVVVVASLGALAWTFGISGVAAIRRGRRQIAELDRRLVESEARTRPTAASVHGLLERLDRYVHQLARRGDA